MYLFKIILFLQTSCSIFDSQISIDHIFPNYRLSIPKENSIKLNFVNNNGNFQFSFRIIYSSDKINKIINKSLNSFLSYILSTVLPYIPITLSQKIPIYFYHSTQDLHYNSSHFNSSKTTYIINNVFNIRFPLKFTYESNSQYSIK